jgi:hypothetical protein
MELKKKISKIQNDVLIQNGRNFVLFYIPFKQIFYFAYIFRDNLLTKNK